MYKGDEHLQHDEATRFSHGTICAPVRAAMEHHLGWCAECRELLEWVWIGLEIKDAWTQLGQDGLAIKPAVHFEEEVVDHCITMVHELRELRHLGDHKESMN